MSRRSFLKWLGGLLAAIFGGAFVIARWFHSPASGAAGGASLTLGAAGTASAAATLPPSQTPSPSPAPRGKGNLLLSFFLFSDMHINAYDPVPSEKLKLALEDVKAFDSKVDTILFGGDLTDYGREADYELLQKMLAAYKLPPLYGNMGNHEYYDIWLTKTGAFSMETMPNGKTDAQSRERFRRFIGYKEQPYFDLWMNGVHLIMVSQEAYVQEKPDVGEGAWYSDDQLSWLREVMRGHEDGRPALVMIHQPLPAIGTDGRTHQLIRAKKFREIMQPYPNVFVFSGHTHRDLNEDGHYTKETFHWFVNSSVGRTRTNGAAANQLAQGMYVQVYENAITVRGREFSKREWIGKASWDLSFV